MQQNLALPSTTSEALSLAHSLMNWKQSEFLPNGVTPDKLEVAKTLIQQTTAGCTVEAFAVIIDGLFTFARTFEVKDFDEAKAEEATRIYRRALIDIPPDLLKLAIDRVIAAHKWGQRLPLPAEIRKHVADQLAERSTAKVRIEMALKFGKEEPREKPQRSPEDIAFARKVVEDAKRAILSPDAS